MGRALWFVAGAAAGTYGAFRARRAAESLTPDGMRDRASGLALGARLFADEVRTGMVEKETELRARLELVPEIRRELDATPPDPPSAISTAPTTRSTHTEDS